MMLLSMAFFDASPRMPMKQATDVFNDWAHRGRDEGMERGHGPAVREMLSAVYKRGRSQTMNPFLSPILDVGTGGLFDWLLNMNNAGMLMGSMVQNT